MPAAKRKTKFLQYQFQKTRLESFHKAVLLGKAKKLVAWPDTHLDSDLLSNLGFFYQPTLQHKDQIQCFCCSKKTFGLKGLSEKDILEKMDCDYSSLMKFFKYDEDSILNEPADDTSITLRLSTFDNYPHSRPSPKSLATAGFIFTPATIDDDSTTCIYCLCVLDGWSNDDDPVVEHRLRNSKCRIFENNKDESSGEEEDVAKTTIKVTEDQETLSDDDFDKEQPKSVINSSQNHKSRNRYGTSKIKKNKMVTSSSNPSSSFVQRSKTEERRSWYREDNNKKRKSHELSSDGDVELTPNKKSKEADLDDESLIEISNIDNSSKQAKATEQKSPNTIDSTFNVLSRSISPMRDIQDASNSVDEVVPRSWSASSDKPVSVTRKSVRKLLTSNRPEKMIEKQGLLDIIDQIASSELYASSEFSELVFDHHDEEMISMINEKEANEEIDTRGKTNHKKASSKRDLEPQESTDVKEAPQRLSHNTAGESHDDHTENFKIRRKTRSGLGTAKIESMREEIESLNHEVQEFNVKNMTSQDRVQDQQKEKGKEQENMRGEKKGEYEEQYQKNEDEDDQNKDKYREGDEKEGRDILVNEVKLPITDAVIPESNHKETLDLPMPAKTDQSVIAQDADPIGKMDRLSIAEIIAEENETIYADRRRTRSSMIPYSPAKAIDDNTIKSVRERLSKKSVDKKTRSSKRGIVKEVTIEKEVNSRKSRKNKRTSSNKKEETPSMIAVENDLKKSDSIAQRSSQSIGKSSGSIIGSPELSSKPIRNQKRSSLMKMMKERNSRLLNSTQREDDSIDSKDQIKIKDKRRDSILISKSPGKSPLKLNKLLDVEESDDIFSRSSPVRGGLIKDTNFGIDRIALTIGKEILGETPSLKAARSPTPTSKLEIQELLPLSPKKAPTLSESSDTGMNVISGNVGVSSNEKEGNGYEGYDDEDYHPLEKPAASIKVVTKRISTERLSEEEGNSSTPNPVPSSKRSSQGPSLRLSILPAVSPERPTERSPVASARFEISKLDDDVILADDDIIRSGDTTKRFEILDRMGFEESSRRTSKLSPRKHASVSSSPVIDKSFNILPLTDGLEQVAAADGENSDDEPKMPGVLEEFNKTSYSVAEEVTDNKVNEMHDDSSLTAIKSSTPLKLISANAESTSLDIQRNGFGKDDKETSLRQQPEDEVELSDLTVNNTSDVKQVMEKRKGTEELDSKWDPSENTLLNQIITEIESSGEYLTKITSSKFESLHEDLDGELTSFISQMPDEELEMSIKEWIFHNARQLKELLDMNLLQMLDVFKKEGERLLKVLEELPVKDDDDNDNDNNK